MTGTTGNPDRPRGRPRRDQRGDIPDELLRALSDALDRKPSSEVTVREIAAFAGTSPEMVRYYFNGKEGLITALLDMSLSRIQTRLKQLGSDLDQADGGHSRLIVECLWALYLDERKAGRLFNNEFARVSSGAREGREAGRADTIIAAITDSLARLVQRGIYRASIDPARTAILIMSLTGCPVRLLDTLSERWINEEDLRGEGWIDDVTAMVDAHCLAGDGP